MVPVTRHRRAGNPMKQILVVDDEPRIAQICRDYLERAGFAVVVAGNGADAVTLARAKQPDLIVLDLGLPKMDGLDVTRAIRSHSNVPIIMLTARVDEGDRVAGLELGADDYITKPFSPRELVARIRAVFRRAELGTTRGEVVRAGGITLDIPRMQVRVGRRAVELTSTEFALLVMLMRQPGRIFTRGQLLDALRGVDADAYDRAIDAHIKNLRRKIEPDAKAPRYVLTVYGVGYRFAEP